MLENSTPLPNQEIALPVELPPNSAAFTENIITSLKDFSNLDESQLSLLNADIQKLNQSIVRFDPKHPIYPHFIELIESRKNIESIVREDFEIYIIALDAIKSENNSAVAALPPLNQKLGTNLELIESLNFLCDRLGENAKITQIKNSAATSFVTISSQHCDPHTISKKPEDRKFIDLEKKNLDLQTANIISSRLKALLEKLDNLCGLIEVGNYHLFYSVVNGGKSFTDTHKTQTFTKILSFFSKIPDISNTQNPSHKNIINIVNKILKAAEELNKKQDSVIDLLIESNKPDIDLIQSQSKLPNLEKSAKPEKPDPVENTKILLEKLQQYKISADSNLVAELTKQTNALIELVSRNKEITGKSAIFDYFAPLLNLQIAEPELIQALENLINAFATSAKVRFKYLYQNIGSRLTDIGNLDLDFDSIMITEAYSPGTNTKKLKKFDEQLTKIEKLLDLNQNVIYASLYQDRNMNRPKLGGIRFVQIKMLYEYTAKISQLITENPKYNNLQTSLSPICEKLQNITQKAKFVYDTEKQIVENFILNKL